MKPRDLKCFEQVANVIGPELAEYELGRVIYDTPWVSANDVIGHAFCGSLSAQEATFWGHIKNGKDPYDHGHEKPEVKEWVYFNSQWCYSVGSDLFKDKNGDTFANNGFQVFAVEKSVNMPDWIPDATALKSESKDNPANKNKVSCKGVEIDEYDVLLAYGVTNPADQDAIKKMLMLGKRGAKDANQDRKEAIQSLNRAIELEENAN